MGDKVSITIFAKKTQKEDVRVEFTAKNSETDLGAFDCVSVAISLPDGSEYTNTWHLYGAVKGEHTVKVTPYKIEIYMTKVKLEEWKGLTDSAALPSNVQKRENTYGYGENSGKRPEDIRPAYPSSNPKRPDWNEIDQAIAKEEENEKPEGQDALQALFQQIYGDADEDTKRAMMKSYQTSGGTVLSTNWKEVAKKDYENDIEAPKGQEVRKWNE